MADRTNDTDKMREAAWDDYARRSMLLVDGVAPDPAKAQTAYYAFTAAWDAHIRTMEAPGLSPAAGMPELPALPSSQYRYSWRDFKFVGASADGTDLFTAAQMLAYGELCRQAAASLARAAVVQGVGQVTDAMVTAYLQANDAYWKRTDELPTAPHKWRTGTPREATRESLQAALSAATRPEVAAPLPTDGYALVPLRMTRAMEDVIGEEGWEWADLLAAAEAVTEAQYDEASAAPLAPAPAGVPTPQAQRWHELKTDPEVFDAVAEGRKTHEIRKNDRGFKVGDGLLLRRTRYSGAEMKSWPHYPLEYTGETERRVVSHILEGYGLSDGWVILSFAASPPPQALTEAPELRMLTEEEVARVVVQHWHKEDDLFNIDFSDAIQRKFAEVNGLPVPKEP